MMFVFVPLNFHAEIRLANSSIDLLQTPAFELRNEEEEK